MPISMFAIEGEFNWKNLAFALRFFFVWYITKMFFKEVNILNHTSNAKSNRSFNIIYIVSSTVTQFYQKLKHIQ